jgi:polar amino acid transport system permease protein
MTFAGGGAHAESQAMVEHPLVGQVADARRRMALRFRLTVVFVWLAIIAAVVIAIGTTNAWNWEFAGTYGPPIVLQGAGITILLSVASIVFATILAVLGALGRLSANPILYGLATFYVSLMRGTPLLVQIYIIYYALPRVNQDLLTLDAIPAGILALSLNYGAYMTEIFRAGIQAVPRGQREAAQALGMPERKLFRRIVLPQAVRIVTPAIGNEFIAMLKDSALVSTISVHETLWLAQRFGRSEFEPVTAFLIAALVYWALTIVFSLFQERLERKMARSDR